MTDRGLRRSGARWAAVLAAGAVCVVGFGLGLPLTAPLAAAEDLPLAPAESVGMSAERLQRVDDYFQRFIDDGQIAGAVTLVARRGQVVHHSAVGWRHREAEVPMSTDAIFTLMSMTKPIVSAALMMLFEEGRFRLDDPIADWIPEYADHQVLEREGPRLRRVPEARPVTIRHVLTHTSGLTLNPRTTRGCRTRSSATSPTTGSRSRPSASGSRGPRAFPGRSIPATSGGTGRRPTTSRCLWRRSRGSPSTCS